MSWIDSMLQRLGYVKAAATSAPDWALVQANTARYDMPELTTVDNQARLYLHLSWMAIAVNLVANACAAQPLAIKKVQASEENKDVPSHPFELLLRRPNPNRSRFDFLFETFAWLRTTGDAYWWLNKAGPTAPPDELWNIPSNQLTPIPDGKLYLAGYEYDPGTGNKKTLPVDQVVHFSGWNPVNAFVGTSPVEQIRMTASADLAMQKWNSNFFGPQNAKASGALAFADPINDEDWKKIQAQLKRELGGTERAMLMLRGVGQGAVHWLNMAMLQKDMEFIQGRQFNKEEILLMCGVHPGGVDPNATEANALAAKAFMAEYTLFPALTSVAETISNTVLPLYGGDLVAEFEDPRKSDRALELTEQQAYERTHTVDEVRKKFYGDTAIGDERGKMLPVEIAAGTYLKLIEPEPEPVPPGLVPGGQPENVPPNQGDQGDMPVEEGDKPAPASAEAAGEGAVRAVVPAPSPVVDDLRRWRDKVKRRGEAVGFESEHFTPGVKALIEQRLAADWESAFDFLKARPDSAALAEARLQKKLTARLDEQLRRVVAAIAAGEEVDVEALSRELRAVLEPELAAIATEEALRLTLEVGIALDVVVINTEALRWAHQYAGGLIKGITETTRQAVAAAVEAFVGTPGMTNADLTRVIGTMFGPVRSKMITITEVTNTFSQATNIHQRLLRAEGLDFVRVWHTSNNDKVCGICGPLDDKDEEEWADEFPDGPAAHVLCNCWTTLRPRKKS